jgi:hypothetical protein
MDIVRSCRGALKIKKKPRGTVQVVSIMLKGGDFMAKKPKQETAPKGKK